MGLKGEMVNGGDWKGSGDAIDAFIDVIDSIV
jgi:hypothetical protein